MDRRPTQQDVSWFLDQHKNKQLELKGTHEFSFDDLRLYTKWKPDVTLPTPTFAGVVFELQIKTFLQHAWSIATHDLIYKTDSISWPKERVAFEIKAMLEHAENAIFS